MQYDGIDPTCSTPQLLRTHMLANEDMSEHAYLSRAECAFGSLMLRSSMMAVDAHFALDKCACTLVFVRGPLT